MNTFLETVGGCKFDFRNPNPDDIVINEIAWALAHQCRFNGHCKKYYSVAEHSCLVADLVHTNELKLQALLHDAAEAYLSDIPSPIKQFLPDYLVMEENLERAIAKKFNVEYPFSPQIKQADRDVLSTEVFYLLPSKGNDWDDMWNGNRPKVNESIRPMCLNPNQAFEMFMTYFNGVKGDTIILPSQSPIIIASR